MRTILIVLVLVLFFIVTLPFYLLLLLLKRFCPLCAARIAQGFIRFGFGLVLLCTGAKKTVLGRENVPAGQPVLYVANHRSLMDTPLAYTTVPTVTSFVSKIEMKRVPFLSWWMRLMNCLFLDREDLRAGLKMVLDGIELIKSGYSIYISPEGTRTHEEEPLPFKEGSVKMAQKTGCPIIPVAISGTDDVLENTWPWVHKASIVIEYGKPIDPNALEGDDKKFMAAYCRNVIIEMRKGHKVYVQGNPSERKKRTESSSTNA